MSTSGNYRSSSHRPIFDGTNYAGWKHKMRMHLEAIDFEIWRIIEQGFVVLNEREPTESDKKNMQLNAQACDILFGALNDDEFGRISTLRSAKQIWDTLEEVYEGTDSVKDSRTDVLRSQFNRFKGSDQESVRSIYSRLTTITNELRGLGATDITDTVIVKKLLMSLDEKYDTLCTLIEERADFKSLTPSQALGRLNAHEMILEEKKELHSSRSAPRRSLALKAKKADSSSDEESSEQTDDEESLGKDMALLVKRFNRFHRANRFKKYELKKRSFSSRDPKKKN